MSNPSVIPELLAARQPHEIALQHGPASARVDLAGALILDFVVGGTRVVTPDTRPNDLPDDIYKIHTMLLAGSPGQDIIHGMSRFLDYEPSEQTPDSITLTALDYVTNLRHTQRVRLEDNGLYVVDEAENLNDHSVGISLGKHFYYDVAAADVPDIRFIRPDGSNTPLKGRRETGEEFEGIFDAGQELAEGRTFFHESFSGSQLVRLPGIGTVRVMARAIKGSEEQDVTLFAWHGGTDGACIEPVTGFSVDPDGTFHNDGIELEPGEVLELRSSVEVVRPVA